MGWKNVKEHYRIEHAVQVTEEGICIGSPYIHNIIVIGFDGLFRKRYQSRGNSDLDRYQQEMDEDLGKLKHLIETPDSFERSVTIWTYDGGEILEKQCEEPSWPNVTHDGQMIYENTFSTDRDQVVRWARADAEAWRQFAVEKVAEVEEQLEKSKARLVEVEANIQALQSA